MTKDERKYGYWKIFAFALGGPVLNDAIDEFGVKKGIVAFLCLIFATHLFVYWLTNTFLGEKN